MRPDGSAAGDVRTAAGTQREPVVRAVGGDDARLCGDQAWTSAGFRLVQQGGYRGTWTFRLRRGGVQDKSRAHIDLTTAHKVPADITPSLRSPAITCLPVNFFPHAPGYKVLVKP